MSVLPVQKIANEVIECLEDEDLVGWFQRVVATDAHLRDCVQKSLLTQFQYDSFKNTIINQMRSKIVELRGTQSLSSNVGLKVMAVLRKNSIKIADPAMDQETDSDLAKTMVLDGISER